MTKNKQVLIKKGQYDPAFCEIVVRIAEDGGKVNQQMKAIGVKSKDTYYRWQKEFSEFKEACEEAKIACAAFYENLNYMSATGQIKSSDKAIERGLKTSDPETYGNIDGNTKITVESVKTLSDEEIEKRIKALEAKTEENVK
jgi:hypothetical protein